MGFFKKTTSNFIERSSKLSVKVKIWNIIGLIVFITPAFISLNLFIFSQIVCFCLVILLVETIDLDSDAGFCFILTSILLWFLVIMVVSYTFIVESPKMIRVMTEKKKRRKMVKLGLLVPDDWEKC
jgi:hypothetical protein